MPEEHYARARYQHRSAVTAARRRAVEIAVEWGAHHLADDLELIVSELVTNALVHGSVDAGRQVGVTYHLNRVRLRVEVRDPGSGLPQQPKPLSESAETGRGLGIVEFLSSRWGVEQRVIGKSVWVELDLQPVVASTGTQ